jgi:hypothetical protein
VRFAGGRQSKLDDHPAHPGGAARRQRCGGWRQLPKALRVYQQSRTGHDQEQRQRQPAAHLLPCVQAPVGRMGGAFGVPGSCTSVRVALRLASDPLSREIGRSRRQAAARSDPDLGRPNVTQTVS